MIADELAEAGRAALSACRISLDRETLVRRAALVEAYCHAADRLERLEARHRKLGYPLLSKGARGAQVAHPLPAEIRREGRHLAGLAKELGLAHAPVVRSMVGRNTRAPDRRADLRAVEE